eukprot:CAMPEP_0181289694 /NCGR_PEP_ID=MMETSP1101-20121128/1018_1 /TAXON_ID=46948 /ORGANISM="Rhodomonas abbreviata, Strain Caron Lab Isolate" /LENGTH=86 /DNA_ID=CAMNT_0023393931 /DNA_START=72 /DNA_END=332 /DNA_ORIENTATION=+
MTEGSKSLDFKYTLSMEYPNSEYASQVSNALAVDEELHADRVHRTVRSDGTKLVAEFAAIDARMLRVSVNSFFDMAILATRTLDEL